MLYLYNHVAISICSTTFSATYDLSLACVILACAAFVPSVFLLLINWTRVTAVPTLFFCTISFLVVSAFYQPYQCFWYQLYYCISSFGQLRHQLYQLYHQLYQLCYLLYTNGIVYHMSMGCTTCNTNGILFQL